MACIIKFKATLCTMSTGVCAIISERARLIRQRKWCILKATRRAELENKLYTDRNENLHARLGVAERAIAEGAIRGKQHAQLMSEKISDTSDELTGLLNELNMIEGEIAKQERVYKEIKDGKGKNNTTAQGRRQPPPRQFSNDEIARIRTRVAKPIMICMKQS